MIERSLIVDSLRRSGNISVMAVLYSTLISVGKSVRERNSLIIDTLLSSSSVSKIFMKLSELTFKITYGA